MEMRGQMSQKILIVDDEVSIITLLTYHIKNAGFQTSIAYDGMEAIKKAESQCFDLIVLDIMLPIMDGMEVCKYLRAKNNETPILMLTAKDGEANKIHGLESGADDYITKPFSPYEVIARIKAILRRTSQVKESSHTVLNNGGLVIDPDRHEATIDGKALTLTRKEFELLLYLTHQKGKVLSRDLLLSEVWDYDFAGDTRIVDVHISRLREKIEPNTKKPIYITTIRGLGYKMEDLLS